MPTIEELVTKVSIKVDKASIDKFDKGTRKVNTGLKKISLRSLGASVGIGLLAGALGASARTLAQYGSNLSNVAQSLNVPIQRLATLQLAAKESGQGFKEIGNALGIVQAQFANLLAGRGFDRRFAGILGNLSRLSGVNLRPFDNGKLKTTSQFLNQIIQALAKVRSERQRVALSQALGFGNILPTISKISRAQKVVSQSVISPKEAAKKGKELQATLADLGYQFKQLELIVGSDLIPVFRALGNAIRATTAFLSNPEKSIKNVEKSIKSFFKRSPPMGSSATFKSTYLDSIEKKYAPNYYKRYNPSLASVKDSTSAAMASSMMNARMMQTPPLKIAGANGGIPADIAAPQNTTNNISNSTSNVVNFNNLNPLLAILNQTELG